MCFTVTVYCVCLLFCSVILFHMLFATKFALNKTKRRYYVSVYYQLFLFFLSACCHCFLFKIYCFHMPLFVSLMLLVVKVVGGMTWCISVCDFDIDVDLLFQENSTIGQKM